MRNIYDIFVCKVRRIILKLTVKKQVVKVWTGFLRFRTVSGGGFCGHGIATADSRRGIVWPAECMVSFSLLSDLQLTIPAHSVLRNLICFPFRYRTVFHI